MKALLPNTQPKGKPNPFPLPHQHKWIHDLDNEVDHEGFDIYFPLKCEECGEEKWEHWMCMHSHQELAELFEKETDKVSLLKRRWSLTKEDIMNCVDIHSYRFGEVLEWLPNHRCFVEKAADNFTYHEDDVLWVSMELRLDWSPRSLNFSGDGWPIIEIKYTRKDEAREEE